MKGILYRDEWMWMIWNPTCGEDLPIYMECNVSFQEGSNILKFNDIEMQVGQKFEYEVEKYNKHSYARLYLPVFIK